MTIGRNPESDFHITSIEISLVHARIFNQGSSWYLKNLCSTNGVYVNGQKLAWQVRLTDNCFVTFGPLESSSFRYVFVENYQVFINMQRNATLGKTIQRSFALVGTSSGAGTATGDITHLSTQPGEDDIKRDFDRKHFESMAINLRKIKSDFFKFKKNFKNKKQELDSIRAEAEMARKELIRIAEKMKGPDALKNVLLNEISCSVCCDIMHEPTVLNCEHTFCFTCINAWSRRGQQHCPVCRKKISWMTKSIRFHSMIDLILDHYLSEEEKKERKESIESRLTDPVFTNEHIIEEYNVGNDNGDEIDVLLNQVESMLPSPNSVHAPTSFTPLVSMSSNFYHFRLRRFFYLINRANELMLNNDENFGSFSNRFPTTDNNSNSNDDSNVPGNDNGDDDADAGGISDIHAEEDEDDVMEVNNDVSDDDNNDVDVIDSSAAAANQGSNQVCIGSSANLNRNCRPVGIGHNASNRWNVRPMRNNNRQSLVQQRLHRIRNSPYPSRNGQSKESVPISY
ncbi:E3 ubiquitin-protein ligase rnf8 [Dermatophagoides farinae]|uniref:E3 ubiquitin-protein ligase CHFR n=1 Tax=Dermatophagoides farinae TaxID=6954 RepID=A0A922HTB0_DERFA|nr:E3 ubiquitin-protein ligase rnf8 [Dermatophagoides farinae]